MSGATATRPFRPSATTSGPIPSPPIPASRMAADPRSERVEVRGTGLARADPAGDVAEQLGRRGAVHGHGQPGLAAPGLRAPPPRVARLTWAPAMFPPASPSAAPTVPTTPGRSV